MRILPEESGNVGGLYPSSGKLQSPRVDDEPAFIAHFYLFAQIEPCAYFSLDTLIIFLLVQADW